MAATMLSVNELVHALLSDVDMGAEPLALGPRDSPFFTTAYGDMVTIATSLYSELTFPNFLATMRRPDPASSDPRFLTTELRKQNIDALHEIVQKWINTFPTAGLLDAQLDEVKLAFGNIHTTKRLKSLSARRRAAHSPRLFCSRTAKATHASDFWRFRSRCSAHRSLFG
jgi:crotonobetainyl-CoA:carnitine CoA-transferase CaiB-like acyl-CoA transferase